MRRRTTGHTSAPRGKRVLVIMQDGTKHVLKFKEHRDKFVTFMDGTRLATKDIATLSIIRR